MELEVEKVSYVCLGVSRLGQRIRTVDGHTDIDCYDGVTQMIRMLGVNINVYKLYIGEEVAWYAKLDEVDYTMPEVAAYVGSILTGNLSGMLSMGTCNYYDLLYEYGIRENDRLNAFHYRYSLQKEKEKISQFHHYHVRLRDLYRNVDSIDVTGLEGVLALYLDRFNNVESTHATFITYFRALPKKERYLFIGMLRNYKRITNDWLKEEGRLSKQSVGTCDFELSKLFELNVLVNRLDTPVDWQQEQYNRQVPQLAKVTPDQVFKHATVLFRLAEREGKRPLKMDFDEYWSQRAIAMPAGAIHDTDPYINGIIKTLPYQIKNKKGLASALPTLDHNYWMSKEKKIDSYTSTKYEWGKARALYGCDFTSHVHADYGLLACEETFPYFIPTGRDANSEYIAEVMKPYSNKIPFCYDYEDFNSQHSFEAMKAVIDAWLVVFGDYLSTEQKKSIVWTRDSVQTQYVNNSLRDERYRSNGTLFSGWRLTSFMNTALNYCYLAQSGINNCTTLHMHNGDDVFSTVDNLAQAVRLYGAAKARGVRANMTKMSIGTIAEFLRTDMRAKNKTSSQYLTRGVATFVHSRIESSAPTSYRNLVEAYSTRYNEVLERGGDYATVRPLYRKQLFFARQLFDVSEETQQKLLSYNTVAGGLNSDGIITDELLVEANYEQSASIVDTLEPHIRPGVKAYTTYLSSKFPQFRNDFTTSTVLNSIVSGYNTLRKTVRTEKADRFELIHKRAMRGAWQNMQGIALINRVRMGINNILVVMSAVSGEKAMSLEKVNDPIAWLALLVKKN